MPMAVIQFLRKEDGSNSPIFRIVDKASREFGCPFVNEVCITVNDEIAHLQRRTNETGKLELELNIPLPYFVSLSQRELHFFIGQTLKLPDATAAIDWIAGADESQDKYNKQFIMATYIKSSIVSVAWSDAVASEEFWDLAKLNSYEPMEMFIEDYLRSQGTKYFRRMFMGQVFRENVADLNASELHQLEEEVLRWNSEPQFSEENIPWRNRVIETLQRQSEIRDQEKINRLKKVV